MFFLLAPISPRHQTCSWKHFDLLADLIAWRGRCPRGDGESDRTGARECPQFAERHPLTSIAESIGYFSCHVANGLSSNANVGDTPRGSIHGEHEIVIVDNHECCPIF